MVDLFTGGIALVVLIFIIAFFWFVPVGLWIAAVAAGVPSEFLIWSGCASDA